MQTVLIVLTAIMGLSSMGMMFMAMIEFVMYLRQSRKQEQQIVVTSVPVQENKPATAPTPAPEVAPVAAEEKAEAPAPIVIEEKAAPAMDPTPAAEAAEEENSVSFEVTESQRQTLEQAYAALNKTNKGYYDKIVAAARELEMARIIEATYAFTVMQGRDTIARLRVLRGTVTLDCTVINPDLVRYNKENGKKIRSRPTRFRVKTKEELDAAIYTMNVANQTALENRRTKKKAD